MAYVEDTIKHFEEQGYEVEITHNRNRNEHHEVDPKGGATIVTLLKDGEQAHKAISVCSKYDNFNRKLGATIALGRIENEVSGEKQRRLERKKNEENS